MRFFLAKPHNPANLSRPPSNLPWRQPVLSASYFYQALCPNCPLKQFMPVPWRAKEAGKPPIRQLLYPWSRYPSRDSHGLLSLNFGWLGEPSRYYIQSRSTSQVFYYADYYLPVWTAEDDLRIPHNGRIRFLIVYNPKVFVLSSSWFVSLFLSGLHLYTNLSLTESRNFFLEKYGDKPKVGKNEIERDYKYADVVDLVKRKNWRKLAVCGMCAHAGNKIPMVYKTIPIDY